MRVPSRDIGFHINYLDLHLAIVAQGASWNPDVADDMTRRMKVLFDNSIHTLAEYGLIGDNNDEEEDCTGPVSSHELIEPHTVFLMEDENG